MMSSGNVNVALVHGAWADGSSWSKIIRLLAADGIRAMAPPLPLISFQDDVAALDRALERVPGPVVLAGHAYAGAVIAATRSDKVKALVYVAALAPDEGEIGRWTAASTTSSSAAAFGAKAALKAMSGR